MESKAATDHELVPPTGIRPVETKALQLPDQLVALDRPESRHQATSLTFSSIPSTTGKARFL